MSCILDTWGCEGNIKWYLVFKEEIGGKNILSEKPIVHCCLHHPCSRAAPSLSRVRGMAVNQNHPYLVNFSVTQQQKSLKVSCQLILPFNLAEEGEAVGRCSSGEMF